MNPTIFLNALTLLFSPVNLLIFLFVTVLGIIAGAVPGIGASLTMTLLIPITFFLPPKIGLMILVAAWGSATYGGSISAILINTPGTGGNVATSFDGFPMARDGKAKVALGISATASLIGGLFGIGVLIFFSPIITTFAMKFGPSEYFLLSIFGIVIVSTSSKGSGIRGLISAGIGLMIGFIGYDTISGHLRYTFGTLYLQDGIPFLVVIIGIFAVAQVMAFGSEKGTIALTGEIRGSLFEGIKLTFRHWKTLLKSSLIGTLFGFAPGVGVTAASLVAYGEAVSSSRNPERFGNGAPEGIVAPESANNAVQGGALIPALTLGIPGNSDSAVFLGGLMMYGINPGRDLFVKNPDLVMVLFIALVLSQFAFWGCGLSLTPIFARITVIPINLLMPLVWLMAATGAYALHHNSTDVFVAIALGVLAYIMKKLKFPTIPLLMAVILGPIAEKNFMRAMMLSDNSPAILFGGIINPVILVLICFALLLPSIRRLREKSNTSRKG